MLRVLLLFAVLLTSALAANTDLLPGLDPNGRQNAAPTADLLGGLDPDGAK